MRLRRQQTALCQDSCNSSESIEMPYPFRDTYQSTVDADSLNLLLSWISFLVHDPRVIQGENLPWPIQTSFIRKSVNH